MSDQLLTPSQVAVILSADTKGSVSERYVKELLKDGEIKGKKVANKWRILRSAVDEYLGGGK